MVNPKAVRDNLREWCKNPYWKAFYEGAPSELCRDYIALDFYASETEDEEAFEMMDLFEKDFKRTDLEYLYKNATGPEKAKFAKMLNM